MKSVAPELAHFKSRIVSVQHHPGSTQTDVPVCSRTPRADHENMVTRRVAVSCELGGGGR